MAKITLEFDDYELPVVAGCIMRDGHRLFRERYPALAEFRFREAARIYDAGGHPDMAERCRELAEMADRSDVGAARAARSGGQGEACAPSPAPSPTPCACEAWRPSCGCEAAS